jgi:phosphate transport system protein
MTIHFQKEIEYVKGEILTMGHKVEEQLRDALKSVEEKDAFLAQNVIDDDLKVNQMEVEIEEECLKILALYQPVAFDLRLLVAILKINNDLERIGDMATNISACAIAIKNMDEEQDIFFAFENLAEKVLSMFRRSMAAFVTLDYLAALEIIEEDKKVDEVHRSLLAVIGERISKDGSRTEYYLRYLTISKNLERIGDHATNIAEDIAYMVNGKIIRR